MCPARASFRRRRALGYAGLVRIRGAEWIACIGVLVASATARSRRPRARDPLQPRRPVERGAGDEPAVQLWTQLVERRTRRVRRRVSRLACCRGAVSPRRGARHRIDRRLLLDGAGDEERRRSSRTQARCSGDRSGFARRDRRCGVAVLRPAPALALALALASCYPTIVSGAYSCGSDSSCPPGLTCSGLLCVDPSEVTAFACDPRDLHEPDDTPADAFDAGRLRLPDRR